MIDVIYLVNTIALSSLKSSCTFFSYTTHDGLVGTSTGDEYRRASGLPHVPPKALLALERKGAVIAGSEHKLPIKRENETVDIHKNSVI